MSKVTIGELKQRNFALENANDILAKQNEKLNHDLAIKEQHALLWRKRYDALTKAIVDLSKAGISLNIADIIWANDRMEEIDQKGTKFIKDNAKDFPLRLDQ